MILILSWAGTASDTSASAVARRISGSAETARESMRFTLTASVRLRRRRSFRHLVPPAAAAALGNVGIIQVLHVEALVDQVLLRVLEPGRDLQGRGLHAADVGNASHTAHH